MAAQRSSWKVYCKQGTQLGEVKRRGSGYVCSAEGYNGFPSTWDGVRDFFDCYPGCYILEGMTKRIVANM